MSHHYFQLSFCTYDEIQDQFDYALERTKLQPTEMFLEIVKFDKYPVKFADVPLLPINAPEIAVISGYPVVKQKEDGFS